MSRRIRRTKQVELDIIDIYLFIHRDSARAAEKVMAAIDRSIRSLADAPGLGRYWSSTDPRLDGLRVTTVRPYRNYVIFFRKAAGGDIEVFRVLHGARDLQPLVDEIDFDFEQDE